MKKSLLKGVVKGKEAEVKVLFDNAYAVRNIMKKRLEELISESNRTSINKKSYESPSWPYLQADSVGYERALREVISLLE